MKKILILILGLILVYSQFYSRIPNFILNYKNYTFWKFAYEAFYGILIITTGVSLIYLAITGKRLIKLNLHRKTKHVDN